ncbi:MAG: peptidase C14, partial [Bacteroidetes bacterium]
EYIADLANPVKDAEIFKEVLLSSYMFDKDNLYLLKNATRSVIIQKFEELSNNLNENDNLIIFYAGHGYWDAYKEIGYWLPSDAQSNSNSNWLRNSTVKDYIGAIKSKHTLLITDACFSGSIFQTRGFKGKQVVAYQKIYNLQSRKGMTSGTLKEVPDVSVFLNVLIKRLKQNEDKYLPVSKLFATMRDAVLNNSPNVPQFGTIQGAGDEGGEFIFIKKDAD